MDMVTTINALECLNANKPLDCDGDVMQLLECNLHATFEKYNLQLHDLNTLVPQIAAFNTEDETPLGKYIFLNFHLLFQLIDTLEAEQSALLSVQHNSSIRHILRHLCGLGIQCNLSERMPQYVKCKSDSFYNEDDLIVKQYNRLTTTTYGLFVCLKCVKLRALVAMDYLQPILNSLYQIMYCPIKKPNADNGTFKMTVELYDRLITERVTFTSCLEHLTQLLHKSIYVKETMLLLESSSTNIWFKRAVSLNLTKILRSEKGLETIAVAMLENSADYDPNDSTKTWKTIDIIVKLILSLKQSPDFKTNVCKQVNDLLLLNARNGNHVKPFESIFIACIKALYMDDEVLTHAYFLNTLLNPLINFTNTNNTYADGDDVTDMLQQTIRLLYAGFASNNVNNPDLPLDILTPVINIIFRLYSVTVGTDLSDLNHTLAQIVIKYLIQHKEDSVELYDAFLFNFKSTVNSSTEDFWVKIIKNEIIISKVSILNTDKLAGDIIQLLEAHGELITNFFIYLLKCLNNKEKYFCKQNEEVPEDIIHKGFERSLLVYGLLSNLAENKVIQTSINNNPKNIIDYIYSILIDAINKNIHISKEIDSDNFQSVFVSIMILQALLKGCQGDHMDDYNILKEPLIIFLTHSANEELRQLVSSIVKTLDSKISNYGSSQMELSELDRAIEDVCDPLIPVRGHGLLTLSKLIQNKDPKTLERKIYILNIFQQNLKNDDSFIYLSAINGLASMGHLSPEIVIKSLTDEFANFNSDQGGNELRMKLGEVLVRVTKQLGSAAPKYKSLLLNTFLAGTKDDDHLIRASSLSNLGEICRVLGYKLGSIVLEVLECIHGILTADGSIEARRAAVTVIRQLFEGLESETVSFLKDDISDIYTTLKNIYCNDNDDVMRLQAQLALEELNENVKKFLSGNRKVQFNRNIVQ